MSSTEKKFRLTARRVLLTYKTQIDKTLLKDLFENVRPLKFFRAAHEKSDKINAYEHTHVLVEFAQRPDIKNCRVFDVVTEEEKEASVIHPNIEILRTIQHWRNAMKYIAKQDPANADLLNEKSVCEKIWEQSSLQDALASCANNLSEVNGVISAWRCKPDEQYETPHFEFLPWENEVIKYLDSAVDRTIMWIYDKKGGIGKSTFGAWLADHRDALLLTQFGGGYHSATVIQSARNTGWTGDIAVIDLPRQCADKAIYEPIEMIKNGRMTALKYQGQSMAWKPGHVVVFANFLPYRGQWSDDRYLVLQVKQREATPAALTLGMLPDAPFRMST